MTERDVVSNFGAAWDAVLFDLDGTIADTVPLILASFRHTMTVHRGAPLPDQEWLAHVGRPLRDSMLHFARDEAEAVTLRETYVAFQREHHDDMVRPFDGIVDVMDEIRGLGIPMALVTSKARPMTLRTLDVCGVSGAFAVEITADEVKNGKPHPEPVHMALSAIAGARPERTLFVGDSPHDVTAGRAAGVVTVAVDWGAAPEEDLVASGPHHLIRSPAELLRLRR